MKNIGSTLYWKKINDEINYKSDQFLIEDFYVAYFLGFAWGDGYLSKRNNRFYLNLSIEKNDAAYLEEILIKTKISYWKSQVSQPNRKPQMSFTIKDAIFNAFLGKMNFNKKSTEPPISLLGRIPDKFLYAFYLGFSDADGCFYLNKKNYLYHYVMSGPFNYDWSFFTKKLTDLNIKSSILRKTFKNGNQASYVRISNRKEIVKLINFLYQENLLSGLQRKKEKASFFLRD